MHIDKLLYNILFQEKPRKGTANPLTSTLASPHGTSVDKRVRNYDSKQSLRKKKKLEFMRVSSSPLIPVSLTNNFTALPDCFILPF